MRSLSYLELKKGCFRGKIDNTTEDAQVTNNTSVMMTSVAGNPQAIGYISLGSLDDSVKALKVDGAEATAENVKVILIKLHVHSILLQKKA